MRFSVFKKNIEEKTKSSKRLEMREKEKTMRPTDILVTVVVFVLVPVFEAFVGVFFKIGRVRFAGLVDDFSNVFGLDAFLEVLARPERIPRVLALLLHLHRPPYFPLHRH